MHDFEIFAVIDSPSSGEPHRVDLSEPIALAHTHMRRIGDIIIDSGGLLAPIM